MLVVNVALEVPEPNFTKAQETLGFDGAWAEESQAHFSSAFSRPKCAKAFHAVPRKGLMHAYSADELIADIDKLGYKDIILKSDGEKALVHQR